MAQTLTLARPARNLRPYLWLALPLLVLATLPSTRQPRVANTAICKVLSSAPIKRFESITCQTLAFTFIYGSAGLLNGTLMALFAFELPPVDFLYSINGVILAEITVFTPLVMRPLMAGLRPVGKSH
jgi:2-aminoethylphosphonate transport system permease protein